MKKKSQQVKCYIHFWKDDGDKKPYTSEYPACSTIEEAKEAYWEFAGICKYLHTMVFSLYEPTEEINIEEIIREDSLEEQEECAQGDIELSQLKSDYQADTFR